MAKTAEQVQKEKVKQWLAFGALLIFGLVLLGFLRHFIVTFLGAVIFYILFKPFMIYLTEKKNWKRWLSATVIIILSFIIILVPIFTLCFMLYSKVGELISNPQDLFSSAHDLDERLKELTGTSFLSGQSMESMKQQAAQLIPGFIGSMLRMLAQITIMYFILYYMLVYMNETDKGVHDLLPFSEKNNHILYDELVSQTYSNAFSVPFLALLQGMAAWFGFWVFGIPQPFFWGMMCAFASFLPIIGTTLIWMPVALGHIIGGNTGEGLGMIAYGLIVIINIDNVFRFILQKKFAEVHPIITVFGVILGLNLFGLPGIIFGPLIISYFLIFVRMYRKAYKNGEGLF